MASNTWYSMNGSRSCRAKRATSKKFGWTYVKIIKENIQKSSIILTGALFFIQKNNYSSYWACADTNVVVFTYGLIKKDGKGCA